MFKFWALLLVVLLKDSYYANASPPLTPCLPPGTTGARNLIRCNFTTASINNLGGFCSPPGTCSGFDPPVIRYDDACTVNGRTFSVVLDVVAGTYNPIPARTPTTPNTGGLNNNGVLGSMGQINQRVGSGNLTLRVRFLTATGRAVRISGEMVFVNMNNGKCSCNPRPDNGSCDECEECNGARTFISVPRAVVNGLTGPPLDFEARDFVLPRMTTTLCRQGTPGRVEFASTTRGNSFGGTDNPTQIGTDPWYVSPDLNSQQLNAGFGFIFNERTQFRFVWDIRNGSPEFGKNLVFGVNVFDCPSD